MRLALNFLFFGAFAALSFVSGLRNVTLDDNDPSIVYSAGWDVSTGNNSRDFGGSLHFSASSTASASLTFQGVAVYLLSPFWPSRVGAQVVLDGQGPFVIDFEDYGVAQERGLGQETLQSQVVWRATGLLDTNHTIVISMPPSMQHVVLDGLIYSAKEANNANDNAESLEISTSFSFTTITTTEPFSSSSSPSPASSFVQSTTISSSPPSSSSNLSPSSTLSTATHFTNGPVNVADAPPTSASIVTASNSAAPAVTVSALSTSVKRSIVIGSLFGATMIILVVIALLTCLRRRRIRQRRQQSRAWSQKFTPYPSHAARVASKPPPLRSTPPRSNPRPRSPLQYEHSPATAVPLLTPAAPAARRAPRSPLATAPPIMPATPSPQSADFPLPPAVYTVAPMSPAPMTPLPLTPLPPATPGTPWTITKSNRLSTASTYSYESSSVESGAGYGWTTPSLVGIHPFSALADPEPSGSSSSSSRPSARAKQTAMKTPTTPTALEPRLNEKSAAALFRTDAETQRISAAPAYREKDATRLFEARPRAESHASETAPPVYEP